MAVTYQNKTEVSEPSATTTLTMSAPSGFSAGDLFIAIVTKDGDDAITEPTGSTWTLIDTLDEPAGRDSRVAAYYRVAQAGDTSWDWTGPSEEWYGVILRYTGQAASPIYDSSITNGDSDTPQSPSVAYTDLETGSIAIHYFGSDDDDTPYVTTGLTERYNGVSSTGSGTCGGAGGEVSASGTGSTGTFDFGQLYAEEWIAGTIVIEAGAAGDRSASTTSTSTTNDSVTVSLYDYVREISVSDTSTATEQVIVPGGGRVFSSGFELNSATNGVEFDAIYSNTTIVTDPVRSGTYAMRGNPSNGSGGAAVVDYQDDWGNAARGVFYFRTYIRLASVTSTRNGIFSIEDYQGNGMFDVMFNSDRAIVLYDYYNWVQIGSDSEPLDLDKWYRIELKVDDTVAASTYAELKINGSTVASGSIDLEDPGYYVPQGIVIFGNQWNSKTFDAYFDDLAVNKQTGVSENSWPGEGKIVHLKPNGAGDNSDWTNDYSYVDEVTPDDATTIVSSSTTDHIDDHNIENASLTSDDQVKLVAVGVRYRGTSTIHTNSKFALRIKAEAAGTVEEGIVYTPFDNGWETNQPNRQSSGDDDDFNYTLTVYEKPGTTDVWTDSDLDTAQIGYRLTDGKTNATEISTVWALVEYLAPYDVSVSDVSTVDDSVTVRINNTAVVADTSTTNDSITSVGGDGIANVSDASTIADDITAERVTAVTNRDAEATSTSTIDDSVTVRVNTSAIVQDTSTVDDAVTARVNATAVVSDTSTVDDSIIVVGGNGIAVVSSTSTIDDAITIIANLNANVQDTSTLDDSVSSVGGDGVASVSDTSTTEDSIQSKSGNCLIDISDTSTAGDYIIATTDITSRNIPVSDVSSVSDSITGQLVPLNTSVSDTSTVDDSVSVQINLPINVSDTSTVADSITSVGGDDTASISDTSTSDDSITIERITNLEISVSDTSTAVDYLPPWYGGDKSTVSDEITVEKSTADAHDAEVVSTSTVGDSITIKASSCIASVSDTSTTDDSVTVSRLTHPEISISDTSTVDDSVVGDAGDGQAIISDTSTIDDGWPGYPVDGTYVSDEVTVERVDSENLRTINISDTSTVSDSIEAVAGNAIAEVSDTSTVDDAITAKAGDCLIDVTDTSTVDDQITVSFSELNIVITDTSSTNDFIIIDATGDNYAVVSDTSTTSDSITSVASTDLAEVADTSTLDDTVTAERVDYVRNISVSDTSTIDDSIVSVGGDGVAVVADTSTTDDAIIVNEYDYAREISVTSTSTTNDAIISVGGDGVAVVSDVSTVDDVVTCVRGGAQNIHIVDGFGPLGGCKKKIIMVDGNLAMRVGCFYHVSI